MYVCIVVFIPVSWLLLCIVVVVIIYNGLMTSACITPPRINITNKQTLNESVERETDQLCFPVSYSGRIQHLVTSLHTLFLSLSLRTDACRVLFAVHTSVLVVMNRLTPLPISFKSCRVFRSPPKKKTWLIHYDARRLHIYDPVRELENYIKLTRP